LTGQDPSQRIVKAFRERFGEPALLVRSPGRVNLIGEHTDFNLGFVLPAAVDKAIWLALSPRQDDLCRFHAVDLGESFEIRLADLAPSELQWPNYLLGVYSEMAKDGHAPRGVDCAFGGDVPVGSGMSSSAALECGFAFGLNQFFGCGYDRQAQARLGQRTENHFVGVNCGIMDQFASVLGRERRLIRLDCRDLSHEYIPFEDPSLLVVLCDTHVRRSLATGGEYNARRAQCEAGVAGLARRFPEVRSLRDATLEKLEACRGELDPVVYRRCAYVVRENQRVVDACADLKAGDYEAFGRRMNESHAGLRDEYEVSCRELDLLAAGAQALPGVLGSRMMGAGFGGCTINLLREADLPAFREGMATVYRRDLDREPVLHVCRLTGGTEVLALDPAL
jgi:galactokinase